MRYPFKGPSGCTLFELRPDNAELWLLLSAAPEDNTAYSSERDRHRKWRLSIRVRNEVQATATGSVSPTRINLEYRRAVRSAPENSFR